MSSPKRLKLDDRWQHSFIKLAVEGNIAAGKSTFLKLLSDEGNFKMCPEPVLDWTDISLSKDVDQSADNNLLAKFYEDPARWALTFQNYALFSRVRNQPKLDRSGVYLCERSVFSDRLIFGRNGLKTGIMTPLEYSLYCKWHSFLTEGNSDTEVGSLSFYPHPFKFIILLPFCLSFFLSFFGLLMQPFQVDGFIYLQCTPDICMKRLEQRGRSEENSVPLEYLSQIHTRHEEWFVERSDLPNAVSSKPTLVIDCTKDIVNDAQYRSEVLNKVLVFAGAIANPKQTGC